MDLGADYMAYAFWVQHSGALGEVCWAWRQWLQW